MRNIRIAQVGVSTIKGTSKEAVYPKTIDKAVYTKDIQNNAVPLDKVLIEWKDKEYAPSSFSGLGRTMLKKNVVNNSNILTADMFKTNTEYYIQYDYEIYDDPELGRTINLPANVSLIFIGGSIKNGTIVGNNTRIEAKKGVCIFDNITIQGTWDVAEAYSSWFKMHKKGYKIVDNSVAESAVTKYHGSDNVYHELETLTTKSNVYFVKSTLSSGAVRVSSIFVPFLTLEFYRGSDNEQYALSTLTSVSNVNFVKSTLGEGSNVVESSVFATETTGTFYKGTDKKYYTIDEVTLVDDVYYVTSTLEEGEVVSTSVATTAVTMYLANDEKYYEASSLQSVDSTYFVTSTLNSGTVKVDSVFAVGVYKGNNNKYYSLGRLVQVASTDFVASTLDSGSVTYGSVFTVPEVYSTFRVEGYNTDSTIDYVATVQAVPGSFDASSYEQYNDTSALQSLLDLRAKRTIIEDGIYVIKADTNYDNHRYNGLYIDNHKDSELVLEGWLKVYPNNRTGCFALDVIGCDNFKITGKGGIQGDLLEHTGTGGEGGMNLAVAGTRNFTVESITTAYAWGDCIYSHWWTNGRVGTIRDNTMQEYHTYKNVKVIYGGRTGYGCERANNVVFDGCYFYGTGRVRGKATNSAVDIEPFNYADTPQRYVMNYEFKNNVFENSANGIRLERCVNCSVHDNYFDFGWSGITVIWHTDVSYDITSPDDRGWLKSRMSIYDNFIRRCTNGIRLGYGTFGIENISIYNNTLVSCGSPIGSNDKTIVTNCNIYGNTTYGCGRWGFHALVDSTIHDNRSYGCKMPLNTNSWGASIIIAIGVANSSGSSFYRNSFSLDYGKPIKGLNADGKEELYHGLPVGFRSAATSGCTLTEPSKVYFYENHISDDFYVLYTSNYNYQGNNKFEGGINTLRNENSEVFIKGDTFRSSTYGDEGEVVQGCILSQSWLANVRDFANMSSGDFVEYGEIIKSGSYYYTCSKAGTVGDTLRGGTATFLSDDAKIFSAPGGTLKIAFKTRGVCTSLTRPDSFLYAGRRMWETDTNKEIVYNGSSWVYNDIYTEE